MNNSNVKKSFITAEKGPVFVYIDADPGTNVSVYNNNDKLGNAVEVTPGKFQLSINSLNDGIYYIFVHSEDSSGNVSVSAPFIFEIDTSGPADVKILYIKDLNGNNISEITYETQAVVTVESDPGIQVDMVIDDISVGPFQEIASGIYEFLTDSLSEGVYEFSAIATDLAGNTVQSDTRILEIDTTAPSVPFITTANNALKKSDQSIDILVSAEPDSIVKVYQDSVYIGDASTSTDPSLYILSTGLLPVGSYTYTATAEDDLGNVSDQSNTLTVTVENQGVLIEDYTSTAQDWIGNASKLSIIDDDLNWVGAQYDGASQRTIAAPERLTMDLDKNYRLTFYSKNLDYSENTSSRIEIGPFLLFGYRDGPDRVGLRSTGDNYPFFFPNTFAIDTTRDEYAEWDMRIHSLNASQSELIVFKNGDLIGYKTINKPSIPTNRYIDTSAILISVEQEQQYVSTVILREYVVSPPFINSIDEDTGISDFDKITSDQQLTLTLTADTGTEVEVFADGVSLGLATEVGPVTQVLAEFTYETDVLADGEYEFVVTSRLDADNQAESEPDDITIDTQINPPVLVSITDDTGSSNTDFITNDSSPELTINGKQKSQIEIYDNGELIGTAIKKSPGKYSFNATDLEDGVHIISMVITDAAGNTATSDDYTLIIDTVAPDSPVFTDISSSIGQSLEPGDITLDPEIVFTISAESGSEVVIFQDGVKLADAVETATPGIFSYSQTFNDGTYEFTATAKDTAGNISAQTDPSFGIIILAVPPQVPVFTYVNDSVSGVQLSSGDFSLSGSVDITITADTGTKVELYDGSNLISEVQETAAIGIYKITLENLQEKTYNLKIKSTNIADVSSESDSFELKVDFTPPAAPYISSINSDSGISSTDFITNDDSISINIFSENDTVVEVFRDSVYIGDAAFVSTNNYNITQNLSDGVYEYYVVSTDQAGNSIQSEVVNITVDTVPPSVPTISAVPSESGTVLTLLSDPGVVVEVFNYTTLLGEATETSTPGTYEFSITGSGTYSISATSTDPAGNFSKSGSLSVLISAPASVDVFDSSVASFSGESKLVPGTNNVIETGSRYSRNGQVIFLQNAPLATGKWFYELEHIEGNRYFNAGWTVNDIATNTDASWTLRVYTYNLNIPAYTQLLIGIDIGSAGATLKVFNRNPTTQDVKEYKNCYNCRFSTNEIGPFYPTFGTKDSGGGSSRIMLKIDTDQMSIYQQDPLVEFLDTEGYLPLSQAFS